MFGQKINEFDNTKGTIEDFNRIFPNTTLGGTLGEYVEIGEIEDNKNVFAENLFVRKLTFYNQDYEHIGEYFHDFGRNNFYDNEDFAEADNVRFKYYATDLCGNLIAKAYNCKELAEKMDCHISVIKRRLVSNVDENSNTDHLFNVTRREL